MTVKGILKKPEVCLNEEGTSANSFGFGGFDEDSYNPLGSLDAHAARVISKVQKAIATVKSYVAGSEEPQDGEIGSDWHTPKRVRFPEEPVTGALEPEESDEPHGPETPDEELDPYKKEAYPITAAWRRQQEIRKMKNMRLFVNAAEAIKYDDAKAKRNGLEPRSTSQEKAYEKAENLLLSMPYTAPF